MNTSTCAKRSFGLPSEHDNHGEGATGAVLVPATPPSDGENTIPIASEDESTIHGSGGEREAREDGYAQRMRGEVSTHDLSYVARRSTRM